MAAASIGPRATVSSAYAEPAATGEGLAAVDTFPKHVVVELVRGETVQVSGSFVFVLTVDNERYLPMDGEMARQLSQPPVLSGGRGIELVSSSGRCTPVQAMHVSPQGIGRVSAGRVTWEAVLKVDDDASPGARSADLEFSTIWTALTILSSDRHPAREAVPSIKVSMKIWGSRAEQERATRAAQEAIAKARAANRAWWLWRGGGAAALLAVLMLVLLALRHRLWPDVRIKVSARSHVQQPAAVASRRSDVGKEFGTIVETVWTRNFRGHAQPIKVEYLTGVSEDSALDDLGSRAFETYAHGEYRTQRPPRWRGGDAKLDVLVSVGASVKRGRYLAIGHHGSAQVTVD